MARNQGGWGKALELPRVLDISNMGGEKMYGRDIIAIHKEYVQFEFDPNKSVLNLDKHGIDFIEAQSMWDDEDRIEYDLEYGGERRFAVVSRLTDGHWTAICTMRGEKVRIISVRRSTVEEVSHYDRANDDR